MEEIQSLIEEMMAHQRWEGCEKGSEVKEKESSDLYTLQKDTL